MMSSDIRRDAGSLVRSVCQIEYVIFVCLFFELFISWHMCVIRGVRASVQARTRSYRVIPHN